MQAEIFRSTCGEHFKNKYGYGPFSIFSVMKQIYHKEGFTALYRGMGASLIGVSNPIVFFPVYEMMKFYLKNNFEDPSAEKLSSKYLIASTITGKIFANGISYPHQVIRARLQYEKVGDVMVKESMPKLIVRMVR